MQLFHKASSELSRKLFTLVTNSAYFHNELINTLPESEQLIAEIPEYPHRVTFYLARSYSNRYTDLCYSKCREATYINQDTSISEKELSVENCAAQPFTNLHSPVVITGIRHSTCWITPSPTQTYWNDANTEVCNTWSKKSEMKNSHITFWDCHHTKRKGGISDD